MVVESDGHRFLKRVLERRHLSPAGLSDVVNLSGGEPTILIAVLSVPAPVTLSSSHQQDLPVVIFLLIFYFSPFLTIPC